MSSSEQCSTEFLNVIISESDLYCPPQYKLVYLDGARKSVNTSLSNANSDLSGENVWQTPPGGLDVL